jgi:hypothetical protein
MQTSRIHTAISVERLGAVVMDLSSLSWLKLEGHDYKGLKRGLS